MKTVGWKNLGKNKKIKTVLDTKNASNNSLAQVNRNLPN